MTELADFQEQDCDTVLPALDGYGRKLRFLNHQSRKRDTHVPSPS
jgi:hypothetical protein